MIKRAVYPGTTEYGRPWVHLVAPGGYGANEIVKTAGVDEHLPGVQELLSSLKPKGDCLYLVNASLVAGEYTGFNTRGDWFTEAGLRHTPPGWDRIPVTDISRRREAALYTENVHHGGKNWGQVCWGYPTWMNAHRFRHHINTSPDHAYGYVLGAFWDDRMKRVILVSELLRSLCEQKGALDTYLRIERGEYPDTSMGARVPFDRCSICNHYARNPQEYCEHVNNRNPAFGMRKILPSGKRCGVYNDLPRGFDDSFVFRGAEVAATVLADVTHRVRGTKDYTRTLPADRPVHGSARIASSAYYSSAMGGSSPIVGGGGRYTPTTLVETVGRDEGRSFDQEILDTVRRTFEEAGRVDGLSIEDRLTNYMTGLPAERPGKLETGFLLQRLKKMREVQEGRATTSAYADWESRAAAEVRRLGGALGDDLDMESAKLIRALRSWEDAKREGKIKELMRYASPREDQAKSAEAPSSTKLAMLAKRAEMIKRLPTPAPGTITRVHRAMACAPDIPDRVLDTLSELGRPVMTGLLHIGIVLRPREYSRIWLGPGSSHRDYLHDMPYDPEELPPLDECCEDDPGPYMADDLPHHLRPRMRDTLLGLLGSLISARSIFGHSGAIRALDGDSSPSVRVVVRHHPSKLASSYVDYRAGALARCAEVGYLLHDSGGKVADQQTGWLVRAA